MRRFMRWLKNINPEGMMDNKIDLRTPGGATLGVVKKASSPIRCSDRCASFSHWGAIGGKSG